MEMFNGIQASREDKLPNIVRSLQEDIPLIKSEDRLRRNQADEDFTDGVNDRILRLGDDKINGDMVIAIDQVNIIKPMPSPWNTWAAFMKVATMKRPGVIPCAR